MLEMETQDKLVFEVKFSKPPNRKGEVIRIDGEAYERVMEIRRATGFSAKEIVSRMIKYAAEYVEVRE